LDTSREPIYIFPGGWPEIPFEIKPRLNQQLIPLCGLLSQELVAPQTKAILVNGKFWARKSHLE
jgi:hypothetical protein